MVLLDLDLYACNRGLEIAQRMEETLVSFQMKGTLGIFTLLLRGGVSLAKARSDCEFVVIGPREKDNSLDVDIKETTKLILLRLKSA